VRLARSAINCFPLEGVLYMSKPRIEFKPTRGQTELGVDKFLGPYKRELQSANKAGKERVRMIESLMREVLQNTVDLQQIDINKPRELHVDMRTETGAGWIDLACRTETDAGAKSEIAVLRMSNRNVPGLDGSIENDAAKGGYYAFMNFTGDSNKSAGGGAYGFGRSVLFSSSKAKTVLVDTVFEIETSVFRRRLVAVRLADKLQDLKKRYDGSDKLGVLGCTGVEVWGADNARPDIIAPFEEDARDTKGRIAEFSKYLGLHRKAGDLSPGTDFYIIDVDIDGLLTDDEDSEILESNAEQHVISALKGTSYWYAWPALTEDVPKIKIKVGSEYLINSADEMSAALWPIKELVELRKTARIKASPNAKVAHWQWPNWKPKDDAVDPCLKKSNPGSRFFKTRAENVMSIVRFRTNGLVVSYSEEPGTETKSSKIKPVAPKKEGYWHLGIVEILDKNLSERVRKERDGQKFIEDVTHTVWNFSGPVRREPEVSCLVDALRDVARNLYGEEQDADTTAAPGLSAVARFLGGKLKLGGRAPGAADDGGGGGGGGGGNGSKSKTIALNPIQPEILNGITYVVFSTDRLDKDTQYSIEIKVEALIGVQELYGQLHGCTKNAEGTLSEVSHVSGETEAVYVPAPGNVAVSASAKPMVNKPASKKQEVVK
jgi:hypothetical protein